MPVHYCNLKIFLSHIFVRFPGEICYLKLSSTFVYTKIRYLKHEAIFLAPFFETGNLKRTRQGRLESKSSKFETGTHTAAKKLK